VEPGVKRQSDEILELAARRRREKEVVNVEVEPVLLVIFGLEHRSPTGKSEGLYGLPASAVESIVPPGQITFVPGTPPWLLGVVNVRGEIESVLDLKAVLGLGRSEITPESRLLIAQDGDLRSGLLVDRMVDIAPFAPDSIGPPPAPLEEGGSTFLSGETTYADETLLILDLAQVLQQALEKIPGRSGIAPAG